MESDPKKSNSPRSAEIIAGNDDLLTEIILVRLPARSLLRFKSVSKRWRSLISSTFFTQYHSRRFKSLPSFLLRTSAAPEFFYFNPTTRVILPFKFEFPHTRVLQSSHGLLLLEYRNLFYGRRYYCVYNPTTRNWRNLHVDDGGGDKKVKTTSFVLGLSLYFDPSKSPYYKVFCFRRTNSNNPDLLIEIYNSQFQEWEHIITREEPHRCTSPTSMKFGNGVSCNNGIYWIRPTSRSFYYNLETRSFGRPSDIKIPRRGELNKNYIVESNGRAHCVCIYLGPKFDSLVVHELSENGESGWVEKYSADLSPISMAMPEIKRLVDVLGLVRGDKEEDSSVLLHIPGMILCYSFYDRIFEVLFNFRTSPIYKENELQFKCNFTYQFIESLASV